MASKKDSFDRIPLLRGESVVRSLAGSFGSALRETRLTALLGYLIALKPDEFIKFFGFKGKARGVILESRHENDRSDILIETTKGTGIIETKVDASDPFEQVKKYKARWKVLLTQYVPTKNQKRVKNVKYFRWKKVIGLLKKVEKENKDKAKFISSELLNYLEECNMFKRREAVEICAREINEEKTLALFLKARMYGCWYERSSRLPEALYFAPHFGKRLAWQQPGIHVGISYIAKIDNIEVVETWNDLLSVVYDTKGKAWFNSHKVFLDPIHKKWNWKTSKKRAFLFLDTPRLVFNPPVLKENLQKGRGWLSKRFFSFDDLFDAWGCNDF